MSFIHIVSVCILMEHNSSWFLPACRNLFYIFFFYNRIVLFPYLELISCMTAQDSFCFYHKISLPSCYILKSCTKLLRKSQHIFTQGRMLVVLETLTGYNTDFHLSLSPLEHMDCFASTYCNEELQPQKNKILA